MSKSAQAMHCKCAQLAPIQLTACQGTCNCQARLKTSSSADCCDSDVSVCVRAAMNKALTEVGLRAQLPVDVFVCRRQDKPNAAKQHSFVSMISGVTHTLLLLITKA